MKRIVISLVLTLSVFCCLYANENDVAGHLEAAESFYQNENYEDAIGEYEVLILDGFINPYVYYNLSDAYYRNNEIGKAVLNLERALKITPRNKIFQHNKEFFSNLIQEPKKNVAEQFLYKTLLLFSLNEVILVTIILFILFLLTCSYYLFKLNKKVIPYLIAIVTLNIVCFSLLSLKVYDEILLNKYIVVQNVQVRNSPSKDEDISFEINEGRQVVVLSEVGRWVNIKLSVDGLTGWIDKNLIEKI
jgi:tetratricopeptide (TPR) repeat protein